MNFKNFTLKSHNAQLLLFRDVDVESCNPIVKIYCYWENEEREERIHEETILFENETSAQFFISDFSKESAQNWFGNNVPAVEHLEKA